MREELLRDFDTIHILNLHGDSNIGERTPAGEPDENVFEIQQGVSIAFFAREGGKTAALGEVWYADLWGRRKQKYDFLESHDAASTDWKKIEPASPDFLFVPRDRSLEAEFRAGTLISDIFTSHASGMTTHRDHVVLDVRDDVLKRRIRMLRESGEDDERVASQLRLRDANQVSSFRKALEDDEEWEGRFIRCLHRPYDERWLFYGRYMLDRPRYELMQHMLDDNVAIITTKQTQYAFSVFCSRTVCTHKVVSRYDRCYLFPLYLFAPGEANPLCFVNLDAGFLRDVEDKLGLAVSAAANSDPSGTDEPGAHCSPRQLFSYIYALLNAPGYTARYADQLSTSFPRVFLTGNAELFGRLAELGETLLGIQLRREVKPEDLQTAFPTAGSNTVRTISFEGADDAADVGNVSINREQRFEGVPRRAWEHSIGGYLVLEEWLKARRRRDLDHSEVIEFQRIAHAILRSLKVLSDIDAEIDRAGGWPLR